MKIILLKDVRNVGARSEVKEVADGYARNFLFPKKLACPATDEKVSELEALRAQREAELKTEEERLDSTIHSLRGKTATIAARATEKGGLFKIISAEDVAKAIRAQHGLELPESAVHVAEPIKTLGEHAIELRGAFAKADFGILVTAQS